MTQVSKSFAEGYFVVSGLRLHYLEWGNKDAPPLILLHGRTGFAHSWDEVGIFFKERYHVIALDQRGHGESEWDPKSFYHLEAFVNDLEQGVAQLKLPPFILIGHSMGACVALIYAARNPQQVRRLVMEDGGPVGESLLNVIKERTTPPLSFDSWEKAEEYLLQQTRPEMSTGSQRTSNWLDERLRLGLKEEADGRVVWRADTQGLLNPSGGPDLLFLKGQLEVVKDLRCPTLVLQAGINPLLDLLVAQQMVALNPLLRLVVIPGATHNIHQTQFQLYIDTVCAFLGEED